MVVRPLPAWTNIGCSVFVGGKSIVEWQDFPSGTASVSTKMSQGYGLSSSGRTLMGHCIVGFAAVWHMRNLLKPDAVCVSARAARGPLHM